MSKFQFTTTKVNYAQISQKFINYKLFLPSKLRSWSSKKQHKVNSKNGQIQFSLTSIIFRSKGFSPRCSALKFSSTTDRVSSATIHEKSDNTERSRSTSHAQRGRTWTAALQGIYALSTVAERTRARLEVT